jgi:hypothetical protein
MGMNLYDINAELSELLERGFEIDEETGEIIEDIEDKLSALQMAEEIKLENIALYIKNLSAESAAIKAEEKALAERRKAKEKRQESLKKYLADYLQNTGRSKFETPKVRLSFRKSESVDYDASFIEWAYNEKRFLRYKDPDIDKTALKKALKGGEEVPGASLLTKQNLQIK